MPEAVLDNRILEGILDTTDAWIRGRVGLAERRVMSDYRGSFPVFEIARRAVERLVATTGFDLRTVDLKVGREVLDIVVNDIPREIGALIARQDLSIDDVDWFIGRQANLVMLDALCKNLGVPASKHLFNINRVGNTRPAGWVTVLSESLAEKRFESGDPLLVSVYGGGLAWGSLVARAA